MQRFLKSIFVTAAFFSMGIVGIVARAAEPDGAPTAAALTGPFHWVDSGPLIQARPDAKRNVVSIKDPSPVFYDGRWHIYATYAKETGKTSGEWGMVYLSFADWKDADKATPVYLDEYPQFAGYHCAPQIFYFEPQKLWYLVYQSQHPTYSTTTDLSKPETWTKPQSFFDGTPKSVVEGWLDYWVICDDTHAYLFFTDDHGRFYRSRTNLADFPRGFDEPVVVLQDKVARELFEGSSTYRIKGTNQYLTLIEAANENWTRYFKAFIADGLDGEWRPLAAEWGNSFADDTRVRSHDGKPLWTKGISHGELLRVGHDQTMTIDPANLALLYQGLRPGWDPAKTYVQLPYQLGLLRREPKPQPAPAQQADRAHNPLIWADVPDKASSRSAFNGLAQAIVQTTHRDGEIRLTAESPGLSGASIVSRTGSAQEKPEQVSAERARANFGRPVVLAADDVRAFPDAPAGFDKASTNGIAGRTEVFEYDSTVTGKRRKAVVYLPPNYSSDKKYPVLYLLHGIGGNEWEWKGYVHADTVIDNLITADKTVPMIIVMPNGRALADDRSPAPDKIFTPENAEGFAKFERDLLDCLIPAVQAKYFASTNREQRAIAGLSMGGGQSLNFGLKHLDTFAWVGGFSSAPNTKPSAELLPDPAAAREKLKLLYVSCGNKDGLINVSQRVHRHLKEQNIPHIWNVDDHTHDRETWANNVYHFAQRIFR